MIEVNLRAAWVNPGGVVSICGKYGEFIGNIRSGSKAVEVLL